MHREIAARGPMTFERFMELALYAPGAGYYARPERPIGRSGDFYTSVSVGPAFGVLLAGRVAAVCRGLDRPEVIEAGAHDGRLAHDLLTALAAMAPDLAARLRYGILEPSMARRRAQQERLGMWGDRVQWWASWEERTDPVRGVVVSNELLDAFPVRRFEWVAADRCWTESGVTLRDGRLAWCRLPAVGGGPALPPAALGEVLPDGWVLETSPAAVAWWRTAAVRLAEGCLLTFDYGRDEAALPDPARPRGTLRAYRRHQVSEDLLAHPGEQDLTAHVDFGALVAAGEEEGLETEALMAQGRWLGAEMIGLLRRGGWAADWLHRHSRQVQTLVHPQHLGQAMRVLVQRRGGRVGRGSIAGPAT